jgi:hypothetical protein
MTPEELNRTIEFIIASQARLAAAQEQDREDTKAAIHRHDELMKRLAELQVRQSELLVHQSERMDWFEKAHEESSRKIDRLLNMILDRLPPTIH